MHHPGSVHGTPILTPLRPKIDTKMTDIFPDTDIFCEINETLYNPHVKKFSKFADMQTPIPMLDHTLGTLLVFCTVIGVLGNSLACVFFCSKSRRDLVTYLYIVINLTDVVCSVTHLPVTISLLNCRRPGLFNIYAFCAVWETVFCIIQKFSIYLVLLLSITRTIAIVKPFYKIRSRVVMGSLVVYLILLGLFPILQYYITSLRGEFKFSWEGAYCYYNFKENFEHIINLILVGMPPIITFVTFVISLIKLHTSTKIKTCSLSKHSAFKERGKHRASITIAMFTGIFLVCNMPYFINLLQNMTTRFMGVKYPGTYFSTRFMFWYSWHIAKIDSVVMNAACNPILYICRMKRFRAWLVVIGQCKQVRVEDLNETMGGGNVPYTGTVRCKTLHSMSSTVRSTVGPTISAGVTKSPLLIPEKSRSSSPLNGYLEVQGHGASFVRNCSIGSTEDMVLDGREDVGFRNGGQLSEIVDTKSESHF